MVSYSNFMYVVSRDYVQMGSILVPYTPCTMVWKRFLARGLHLFHRVVEEEVYKNCVDVGVGVLANDFAPY